jgi:hypothetical protein
MRGLSHKKPEFANFDVKIAGAIATCSDRCPPMAGPPIVPRPAIAARAIGFST